jgi:hypothetical protein
MPWISPKRGLIGYIFPEYPKLVICLNTRPPNDVVLSVAPTNAVDRGDIIREISLLGSVFCVVCIEVIRLDVFLNMD